MIIISGILSCIAFLASGFAASAPWMVTIDLTTATATYTYDAGMMLLQSANSSSTYSDQLTWCDNYAASSYDCRSNVAFPLLGLFCVFGIGALLSLASAVIAFVAPSRGGIFALAAAFTLQAAAIFGFFFRGVPVLQKLHYESELSAATTVSWSFKYGAYVAFGGAGCALLAFFVYCATVRAAIRSDKAKKNAAEASKPTGAADRA